MSILDAQHFEVPAARVQRTDDAVVHRRADVPMVCAIHRRARCEQSLLFLQPDSAVAFRLLLTPNRWIIENYLPPALNVGSRYGNPIQVALHALAREGVCISSPAGHHIP